MKKLMSVLIVLLFVTFSFESCTPKPATVSGTKYKARFEVAGICSNYTFSVIEGSIDTSLVESSWTDPQTNKAYKNAFAISNPCNFPATLKAGDTFYFEVDTAKAKDCAVCMAYYPTPAKHLNIKVIP